MDGAGIAVLVVLCGAVAWLAFEVRRVHILIEPIANSNVVQGLAAI